MYFHFTVAFAFGSCDDAEQALERQQAEAKKGSSNGNGEGGSSGMGALERMRAAAGGRGGVGN